MSMSSCVPTSVSASRSSARDRVARSRIVRFVRSACIDPLVVYVRARPLQTLGVAFGAGILLASGVRKPVARLLLLAVASRLVDQV